MKRIWFIALAQTVLLGPACGGNEASKDQDTSDIGTDTEAGSDSETDSDTDACVHPEVVESCEDGWCRIEPGCFIMGSPETENPKCRGAYAENQVQVTLTRPFVMQQNVVTQAQWESVGFTNPSRDLDPEKPVELVNWFEAMAYANALSEARGLEPCYDLSSCEGTIGTGCYEEYDGCIPGLNPDWFPEIYVCAGEMHSFEDWYACPGYRLPTAAEWEYAARAGTTTATYNGDILVAIENTPEVMMEPVLEPIAWYLYNSGNVMHKVREKQPNGWGLYDMLGNVREWVDRVFTGYSMSVDEETYEPLADPRGASHEKSIFRELRGENHRSIACRTRAARAFSHFAYVREQSCGFRLVRTLLE